MPPEQFPWDRRDFRKHDRSGPDARFAGGGGGGFGGAGPHRWREQNRYPYPPSPHPQPYRHQNYQPMRQRWYSDFRSTRPIPPGRVRQGGWYMYPEEAGQGFPPFGPSYGDRNLEDDNFRPFRSRGDGRYLRNSRENRGPFSQKDWRSTSWEPPATSSSSPRRPEIEANNQKSMENPLICLNNSSKGNNFEDSQTCLNNDNKDIVSEDTQTCLNNDNKDIVSEDTQTCLNNDNKDIVSEDTQTCLNNDNKDIVSEDTQTCLNNDNKDIVSEDTQTCHDNIIIDDKSDHTLPDSLSDPSQPVMKEKDGETADELVSSDQKPDKEKVPETTEWKLKWNRSGSSSSRGSGFSCSSSSKSMGVDSTEKVVEVQQKNPTPVNSPTAVCVEPKSAAPSPSEDASSRKKPRLGWGEGLAKYEKKKVDGPEDTVEKDGLVKSVSSTETIQQSPSVNLPDKIPNVENVLDCASPATPSLVTCSSSSGVDEKESVKALNIDHDGINLSSSPSIMPQINSTGLTFNLENLDLASITNLSSLVNEMVQSNDSSSVETGYVQTALMNKLLVWKVHVLKALEVTESEIDSLDTELKLLNPEPRSHCPQLAASSLIPGECRTKYCEQVRASSTVRPAPLQVVASGDMVVENMAAVSEDEAETLKDEDIDSPGSAISKLIESLPSGEGTFNSETPECFEKGSNNSSNPRSSEDDQSDEDKTYLVDDHTFRVNTCQDISSVGNVPHLNVGYIYATVLASNEEYAYEAWEELNNLLPAQQRRFDMFDAQNVSSVQRDSLVIKKRFLTRKRSLLFKEKVITLRFKVFQHFWREGRIVSVSKLRGMSHKKLDLCHTDYKKNRSSGRSRIYYSAGSSRKVPAEEVIEYINGLLAESPFKLCRSTLKMPALILDKEIKKSRFISNNALVEDPCAAEIGRSMINPWTAEETEIFIDNLSIFGKDFSKIASVLERKTIADCIEFYYKNHKSECFQRAKQGVSKQAKPQSTYLVANSKRWNREANAVSLDILGETSAIAAKVNDGGSETQQEFSPNIVSSQPSSEKVPMAGHGPSLERSNSLDNEAVAADVLAGICGSLSSEAVSSCITSLVDPTDVYHQDGKVNELSLTPDGTQSDDDESSEDSCVEVDTTDWSDEEKSFFIQAVTSYGKDFAMISQCLRTKSIKQCKMFFSKVRKCLGLDRVVSGSCNGAGSGDFSGGSGTTEEACVVQTGESVTCNDESECKMEVNLPSPESDKAGMSDLKPSCVEIDSQVCSSVAAEPVSTNSSNDAPVDCDVKPSVVSTNVESVGVEDGDDSHQEAAAPSDNNVKDLVKVTNSDYREDPRGQQRLIVLPEDNLEKEKVLDSVATHSAEESVIMRRMDIEMNNQSTGNVSHPCTGFHPKESVSQKQLSVGSPMLSVPIKYQRYSTTDSISDIQQQQHFSDSFQPSQILRGYPVLEMNGDFNCVKHLPQQSENGKLNSDLALRKCSTGLRNGSENFPFTPQEPSRDHLRPDVVDRPQPSRNGDVKLFGKILMSSQNKTSDGNNNNTGQRNKFSGHQMVSSQPKVDFSNYLPSEKNIDFNSFGYWDKNRRANSSSGILPLPDSARLLAKYPAAFSNHYSMDQPTFNNSRPFNGIADYQMLSSRERQPFSLHMNQSQEMFFSEMQRRNGFGLVPGMRSMAGIDRRGVLPTAGQCSGVSDPVTAINENVMWRNFNGDTGR